MKKAPTSEPLTPLCPPERVEPDTRPLEGEAAIEELAILAKALGHPARIQILKLLLEKNTCICGDIVDELPLAQSTVSEHLRILKAAGLLRGAVDGLRVNYCIAPRTLQRFRALVGTLSIRPLAPTGDQRANFKDGNPMTSIRIFDPVMCCSTGVCGPTVEPHLAQFAADLDWLATQGVSVTRFNLAQEPEAFVDGAIKQVLELQGIDGLPMIEVDGKVKSTGLYPSRADLAKWTVQENCCMPVAVTVPASQECCPPGSAVTSC